MRCHLIGLLGNLRFNFLLHFYGLTIFIRRLMPEFEAVSFEAGDYVHMHVVYDLPRVLAVIHVDIDAVGGDGFFNSTGKTMHNCCDSSPVFLRHIKYIYRMVLWHDERVAGVYGAYVQKCERFGVLIHFERRQFTGDDFAEDTVGSHVYSIPYTVCRILNTEYEI